MIARVLLPIPVDHPFDFAVAADLSGEISVGGRIVVRFHGKERTGIVQSLEQESDYPGELEPVLRVDRGPSFTPASLVTCLDASAHYLAPPGPFVNRLLPHTATRHRERCLQVTGGLDRITKDIEARSKRAPRQAEVLRFLLAWGGPCAETVLRERLRVKSTVIDRLLALALIEEVPAKTPNWPILHSDRTGVGAQEHTLLFSSSRKGKYVQAIEYALYAGGSVLVLTPEILASRGMHARLRAALSVPVALYHSNLAEGEKGRVWNDTRDGRTRVVVGTRSALFLPFSHLNLVIIDEEQDRSYKQDEMLPHYQARDIVARRADVRAIFGSAAPSIETFYLAQQEKIELAREPAAHRKRAALIVDMKKERGPLSEPLLAAASETLAAGKRVLIGVNARGHFQAVLCKKCGRPLRCPRCGANLTYDVRSAQLVCRVCGTAQPRMACPNCGSRSLRFVGIGSERVEEEMKIRFPNASTARIDRTSLANRAALARAEGAIAGEAQIIVGTPLATKGPVMPGLGLAAAIGVDAILARPDFRAAERTYQYLTGLFDRLDEGGEAVIQTNYPDHYAVIAAAQGDYNLLYAHEIAEREAMFYPPFSHLARMVVPHMKSGERLLRILEGHDVRIVGPAPHPRERGRDVILLKGKDAGVVHNACARVREEVQGTVEIDIDPEQI